MTALTPGTRIYDPLWRETGTVAGTDETTGEIYWHSDKANAITRSPRQILIIIDPETN